MPRNDSHIAQLLTGLSVVDLRVQWAVVRARKNGLKPADEFSGLYLSDELIDLLLEFGIGQHRWTTHQEGSQNWAGRIHEARLAWQEQMGGFQPNSLRSRLSLIIQEFALSLEESELFLLALAPEIDPRFSQIYAYLQDDVMRKKPSVDLLLNLLTDDFEQKLNLRRLLGNNGRLIHNRLLFRSEQGEKDFLSQTVQPYPHIVEFLLNDDQLSSELENIAKLTYISPTWKPKLITTTHLAELSRLSQIEQEQTHPILFFSGNEGNGHAEAAWYMAQHHKQPLISVNTTNLQASRTDNRELLINVVRDGRLYKALLYFTNWEKIHQEVELSPDLAEMLLQYPYTVMISNEKKVQPFITGKRAIYTISFAMPDYADRLSIWTAHLGKETGLDLTAVATHFRFSAAQIEGAVKTARDFARARKDALSNEDLFAASRNHSNQNLAVLATKIEPRYTWQDIVLPTDTLEQLHEIVNTVRYRPQVYDGWGFEKKMSLGKGVSALFAGDSGTGKTMAAEIIAWELHLDLYKVDISTLVSKYIGETEKNLDRIFSEASTSNAILFFDEADAIFGKRSQVKDSHDRYANIEISYLLQRMEAYDGAVFLATNLRSNLDDAFTRRLHFAIEFPFPDVADRVQIWQANFPPETPKTNDIDFLLLAQRYPLAGGNIRNIILAAAFLAAKEDMPVGMAHLLHGTKREYQKMGRLIDESLFTQPSSKILP